MEAKERAPHDGWLQILQILKKYTTTATRRHANKRRPTQQEINTENKGKQTRATQPYRKIQKERKDGKQTAKHSDADEKKTI